MQLDNITIYLSEQDEGFVAIYVKPNQQIVWSETYENLDDARAAYADYAAVGKYVEECET